MYFSFAVGSLDELHFTLLFMEALCQLLLPKNTFGQIKYFAARLVAARRGEDGLLRPS
jgi:hypothetical protein